MNRRELLALIPIALLWKPADEEQPDEIAYWLLVFDESWSRQKDDEALAALLEMKRAIERAGVPGPWRDIYYGLRCIEGHWLAA
jgi:hypothetical protein